MWQRKDLTAQIWLQSLYLNHFVLSQSTNKIRGSPVYEELGHETHVSTDFSGKHLQRKSDRHGAELALFVLLQSVGLTDLCC